MFPDKRRHSSLKRQDQRNEGGGDQRPFLKSATHRIGEQAQPLDTSNAKGRYGFFQPPARRLGGKQQAGNGLVRVERVATGIDLDRQGGANLVGRFPGDRVNARSP